MMQKMIALKLILLVMAFEEFSEAKSVQKSDVGESLLLSQKGSSPMNNYPVHKYHTASTYYPTADGPQSANKLTKSVDTDTQYTNADFDIEKFKSGSVIESVEVKNNAGDEIFGNGQAFFHNKNHPKTTPRPKSNKRPKPPKHKTPTKQNECSDCTHQTTIESGYKQTDSERTTNRKKSPSAKSPIRVTKPISQPTKKPNVMVPRLMLEGSTSKDGISGSSATVVEDEDLMKIHKIISTDPRVRTFLWQPLDEDSSSSGRECITSKNETGSCTYLQQCTLPTVSETIVQFWNDVCRMDNGFVGICCPEFPVYAPQVDWREEFEDGDEEATEFSEECGIASHIRIVGGSEAGKRAYPWMVALLNNKKKFYCGGALINNRYVLTAAHCTLSNAQNQILVRVGEHDFTGDHHSDHRVEKIRVFGRYSRFSLRGDIALLRIRPPARLGGFLRPVCLPRPGDDDAGTIATLAGWGKGSTKDSKPILHEASFPIIENKECFEAHGVPVQSSLVCTSATKHDKGACNGDSGGPLMVQKDDGRWFVVGIVSWGRRGCNPKFPTVYTRVMHYLEWIRKHAAD